jgi:hypothetical protein
MSRKGNGNEKTGEIESDGRLVSMGTGGSRNLPSFDSN